LSYNVVKMHIDDGHPMMHPWALVVNQTQKPPLIIMLTTPLSSKN
jgi:methionine synthase II (cobalamin-independent)